MKTINDILPTAKREWLQDPLLYITGRSRPYSSVCQYLGKYYIMPETMDW